MFLESNPIKYFTGFLAHKTAKSYYFSRIKILIIIVSVCNSI